MNKNNFNIKDALHTGETLIKNTICRICLTPNTNMVSIFSTFLVETECETTSKTSSTMMLLELLNHLTKIQIYKTFSNMVCKTCVKNAHDAYVFKTKVKTTDAWLNSNVSKLNIIKSGKNIERLEKANSKNKQDKIQILTNWLQSKISEREGKESYYEKICKKYDKIKELYEENLTAEVVKTIETNAQPNSAVTSKPESNETQNRSIVNENINLTIDVVPIEVTTENTTQNLETPPHCLRDHDYATAFCEVCEQHFEKDAFKQHYKVHILPVHKCDVCNKGYSRFSDMRNHRLKSHPKKGVVVKHLYYPFKMTAKGEKLFVCELCGKYYRIIRGLINHMQANHVKTKFGCNICGKGFNVRVELLKHLQTHNDGLIYSCAHCSEKFNKTIDITNHVTIHDAEADLLTIPYNPKLYMEKQNEPTLTFTLNENNEKVYPCTFCDKKFKHENEIKIHLSSHTQQQIYLCQICGKTFKYKLSLTGHLKSHDDVRPYECEICNKTYKQKIGLKCHVMSHTGMLPYTCEVCGKRFKERCYLRHHMKYHNNQKEHECQICKKKYMKKGHLTTHMRTHTNEKPFSCKYCFKCFRTRDSRRFHEYSHEGKKPFTCIICQTSFSRPATLRQHKRVHNKTKKK